MHSSEHSTLLAPHFDSSLKHCVALSSFRLKEIKLLQYFYEPSSHIAPDLLRKSGHIKWKTVSENVQGNRGFCFFGLDQKPCAATYTFHFIWPYPARNPGMPGTMDEPGPIALCKQTGPWTIYFGGPV